MASKKNKVKVKKSKTKENPSPIKSDNLGFWGNSKLHYLIVFVFAFVLYANTLGHQYTQDDAIVIYDNMYTTQGVQGIPGLLSKDTFFGFFKEEGKANLVSGGRYRPFTPVMFAIGWEIFGERPFVGHFMNLVWYGLLGIILYLLLNALLVGRTVSKTSKMVVLLATLLFIAHPIHTEVVANIKGRDEIFTLLGSLLAMYWILKPPFKNQIINSLSVAVIFLIALLSKENAITFLGVVPLGLFLFTKDSISQIVKKCIPLLAATVIFLIIRTSILGMDFGGAPRELMNNPYLKLVNGTYVDFSFQEKFATIIYTLGKYIELLIAPITLTHDYYPYQIPIMGFGNWQVWLSIAVYLLLMFFAFFRRGKKSIPTFSILYFIMTLSIVSNIVFPIGTNMSERFMFMPSVGFTLLLAIMLVKYVFKKFGLVLFLAVSFLILTLYSAKTVTRNMVWYDDFTLFQNDVETSFNSAKMLNAAGGSLLAKVATSDDAQLKDQYINKAIGHLNKAIKVHPTYRNAYLLLGNAYYYQSNFTEAIKYYEKVVEFSPGNKDGTNNLAVAYRDLGRYYGEKENNINQGIIYLKKSLQIKPNDSETIRLLGISHGVQGNHSEALTFFKRHTELNPNDVPALKNLMIAYQNTNDLQNAELIKNRILQIDPNSFN